MATHTAHLAEDIRMRLDFDEVLSLDQPHDVDDSADWSSDPMEILMAKQERDRADLELYLSAHTH